MIIKIEKLPYRHTKDMVMDLSNVNYRKGIDGTTEVYATGDKFLLYANDELYKYKITERLFGDIVERWCISTERIKMQDILRKSNKRLMVILTKHHDNVTGAVNCYKYNGNINFIKDMQAIATGSYGCRGDENTPIMHTFLMELLDDAHMYEDEKMIHKINNFLANNPMAMSDRVSMQNDGNQIVRSLDLAYTTTQPYNVSKKWFEDYIYPFFEKNRKLNHVVGTDSIVMEMIDNQLWNRASMKLNTKNPKLEQPFKMEDVDCLEAITDIIYLATFTPMTSFSMSIDLCSDEIKSEIWYDSIDIHSTHKLEQSAINNSIKNRSKDFIKYYLKGMPIENGFFKITKNEEEELQIDMVVNDEKYEWYIDLLLSLFA